MIVKNPILPQRVSKVPRSFSWIDHRLVRDGHNKKCSHEAAALYLFLVCVGDVRGASAISATRRFARIWHSTSRLLQCARSELVRNGLLAWKTPLYQVLSLEPAIEKRS